MSRPAFDKRSRKSPAARAKGRATLELGDVVRAATALLDTQGVEGLSMRGLAAYLETGAATLYWHVRNKDDLLRLIIDETLAEVRAPDQGTWQERLAAIASDARRVLLARPALVQPLWRAGWNLGPETLRVAETIIGLVAESGLADEDVADAYFALVTFVLGFVVAETAAVGTASFGRDDESERRPPEDAAERYPGLTRYGPGTDAAGMQRRFAFGLSGLIDGIADRAAAHRPVTRKPARRRT